MCAVTTSQQFCVRWNSHLGSLGTAFPEFLAAQNFVDVTLACEGHQLHCHRLILASCSSYFSSLLRENPCKHPIIILPRDIKLWEIQALVDFMYRGHVNVSQTGLADLLKSAEILQIRGLSGSEAVLNLNNSGNRFGLQHAMHSKSSSPSFNNNVFGIAGSDGGTISNNDQKSTAATGSGIGSPGSPSSSNEIATAASSVHHPHSRNNNSTPVTNGGISASNSSSSLLENQSSSITSSKNLKLNNDSPVLMAGCNKVMLKEEPIDNTDEVVNDHSMSDLNESIAGQENDSYIGNYADYLDQTKSQETLHHQYQTKQQEQEQNNRNQQEQAPQQQNKSQRINQLQQFKKLITIKSETKQMQNNNQDQLNTNEVNVTRNKNKNSLSDVVAATTTYAVTVSNNDNNFDKNNHNRNINRNNSNNQNKVIKTRSMKRLENKRLSSTSSATSTSFKQSSDYNGNKRVKLHNVNLNNNNDHENENDDSDDNASVVSDTPSLFIVEPEIPVIEIFDEFDENVDKIDNTNRSTDMTENDARNILISASTAATEKINKTLNAAVLNNNFRMSTKNDSANVGNTVKIFMDKNRVRAVRMLTNASDSDGGTDFSKQQQNQQQPRSITLSNSKTIPMKSSKLLLPLFENRNLVLTQTTQKSQQQQQRNATLNNGKHTAAVVAKTSKVVLPLTENRNPMLPSSLKFNSQSMAIYVKTPSEQDINGVSASAITAASTSKSAINLRRAQVSGQNGQHSRKQISQGSSTAKDYFETIKTEYEINGGDNNYESIICAPNVNALYNSVNEGQCEYSIGESFVPVSYDDIQIDENYYNSAGSNETTIIEEHTDAANISFDEQDQNNITSGWPLAMKTGITVKKFCPNRMNGGEVLTCASYGNPSISCSVSSNTATIENQPSSLSYKKKPVQQSTYSLENGCTPLPSAVVLRNPRSNQPRSYNTDALYAALMDVKAGESIYRASQIHKVPRKTLRNWMKRWHIKSAYPMPRQLKQAAEKKKLKQLKNNSNDNN